MLRPAMAIVACAVLWLAPNASADCGAGPIARRDVPLPPIHVIAPSLIRTMGVDSDGAIDPAGAFTLIVRDLADNPVAGAQVDMFFSDCAPAVICLASSSTCVSLFPAEARLSSRTAADGSVTLQLAGCANNSGGTLPLGSGRALIYVDGVLVSTPGVAFFDQNGLDGVGANDLSAFLGDHGTGGFFVRSDFDGDGFLGANDLSAWLALAGTGRSALGCSNHP